LPILEALACGTPVVATTAGACAEVVGSCGILVPPGDTPALIAAINDLLSDRMRLARLGLCARERAITRFGPARACERMMRFYHNALSMLS
jgi:glycosyltransferase involved in cell wall biosynthesis